MIHAVKRSYGKNGHNHDFLHAWDEEYGTSCMGSLKHAMIFPTKEEAEAAAVKAQEVCKGFDGGPAQGVTFSAVSIASKVRVTYSDGSSATHDSIEQAVADGARYMFMTNEQQANVIESFRQGARRKIVAYGFAETWFDVI